MLELPALLPPARVAFPAIRSARRSGNHASLATEGYDAKCARARAASARHSGCGVVRLATANDR